MEVIRQIAARLAAIYHEKKMKTANVTSTCMGYFLRR